MQFLRAAGKERAVPERSAVAQKQTIQHMLARLTYRSQHAGDPRILHPHAILRRQRTRSLLVYACASLSELVDDVLDALKYFRRRVRFLGRS